MTEQHPITPPPELVKQWWKEAQQADYSDGLPCWLNYVATKAARWGADQELEACREWLRHEDLGGCGLTADWLYEARRPKPPSLSDKALSELEEMASILMKNNLPCNTGSIRRALEALPDA